VAASSLSAAGEKDFASLSHYLAVSEPVVDLLPEHFLPVRARADIDATALHQVAVAGKLLYAHSSLTCALPREISPPTVP